ncbi:MAG: class 1 fructose-bisphosphatase [Betaproteobacteria bacterium]|nr:class 1 fructose-bisphosphatase [Betaproteobacteria bacterium]
MDRITLTQYLLEQQRREGGISADLRLLIELVSRSLRTVSIHVGKIALADGAQRTGAPDTGSPTSSEIVAAANEIVLSENEWGGHLAAMASTEIAGTHPIPSRYPRGRYLLVFNPLDTEANVDVNISVGSTFSVLERPEGLDGGEKAFLQPGAQQKAAGYALYGPQTLLILTVGNGVVGFTLDREFGSWIMTQPSMQIPAKTQEFAINSSNARVWDEPIKRYIDELLAGRDGPRGEDFNMRWVASIVADVHRLLSRGGIFIYPRDKRDPRLPGRLRLLFEANPMAMIIEQAGGRASTGTQRILDLQPELMSQRVPVILGSANEVERLESYYAAA